MSAAVQHPFLLLLYTDCPALSLLTCDLLLWRLTKCRDVKLNLLSVCLCIGISGYHQCTMIISLLLNPISIEILNNSYVCVHCSIYIFIFVHFVSIFSHICNTHSALYNRISCAQIHRSHEPLQEESFTCWNGESASKATRNMSHASPYTYKYNDEKWARQILCMFRSNHFHFLHSKHTFSSYAHAHTHTLFHTHTSLARQAIVQLVAHQTPYTFLLSSSFRCCAFSSLCSLDASFFNCWRCISFSSSLEKRVESVRV